MRNDRLVEKNGCDAPERELVTTTDLRKIQHFEPSVYLLLDDPYEAIMRVLIRKHAHKHNIASRTLTSAFRSLV